MSDPDRLLTYEEVAVQLNRSFDWVKRRIRAGELVPVTPGRIRQAEIDRYLREHPAHAHVERPIFATLSATKGGPA